MSGAIDEKYAMCRRGVETDQVWRQKSTGRRYVCVKVGPRKATFVRATSGYTETATVWVARIVKDDDWELVP